MYLVVLQYKDRAVLIFIINRPYISAQSGTAYQLDEYLCHLTVRTYCK